jgi:putative transposase
MGRPSADVGGHRYVAQIKTFVPSCLGRTAEPATKRLKRCQLHWEGRVRVAGPGFVNWNQPLFKYFAFTLPIDPHGVERSKPGAEGDEARYTERLVEAGIEPSVGSVGDSYDNALAESIIGLYKTEIIRRRGPWRNLEAVEFATLEWVHWFNHQRLLESIGHIPPAELEAAYHQSNKELAMAA